MSSKYRIERLLGEGGMGVVYEAMHVELDGRVALKFLRPEALVRSDIVARFAQEARAAVRLKSEHVARVNDVGTHDGVPYLVMELLEGKNLEEVLLATGPLPVARVAEHLVDACEGISEAHARGIIHRDIKPANLFLVENEGMPTIKVLDFGISKAALTGKVSDGDVKSSATTSIMGSPHYMSPEQVRSTRDVDLRTDVWSLGIVLYELLGGRTPFDAKTEFTELVAAILEEAPPPLREVRPDVPAELEAVVVRCLQKDKSRRYQTAAELALALLPFTSNKRAAVVASRAVAVTKRAGLAPDLVVPNTLPPPSPSDPNGVASLSSGRIPSASIPSIDELGRTAIKSSPPDGGLAHTQASRTPLTAGTTLPGERGPAPRRVAPIVLGGAAVVAVLLLAFFFLRPQPSAATQTRATSTTSARTAEAPPAVAPAVTPVAATAPVTPSAAPADAAPAAAVTTRAPATTPTSVMRGAKPAATTKKPDPAHPPAGDLDIRRER